MGKFKLQMMIFSCVVGMVAAAMPFGNLQTNAQPLPAAADPFGNVLTNPQPLPAVANPFGNVQMNAQANPQLLTPVAANPLGNVLMNPQPLPAVANPLSNVQMNPQPFLAVAKPFGNVQMNVQADPRLPRPVTAIPLGNDQTMIPQTSIPAAATPFNLPTTQTGLPQQPNNYHYTQLYNSLLNTNKHLNYYTTQIDQVLSKAENAPLKCMYEVRSKLTEINTVTLASMFYIRTNQFNKLDVTAIHDALSGPVLHRDTCFKVTWAVVRKLAKPSPKITERFGSFVENLKKLDTAYEIVKFFGSKV